MTPLDEIRFHIASRTRETPKILLIAGGPFHNAIGDTVNFAYHLRYLTAAIGPIQTTIWSADTALWQALCGDSVSCTPFIREKEAVYEYDLVVFDWVSVSECVEELYSRSSTALFELLHHGYVRYRLGGKRWKVLRVPPTINHLRRVQQAYERLGLDTAELTSTHSTCPITDRRRGIYLNPYASTAEKCVDEYLFTQIIEAVAARVDGPRLICPSIPSRVPLGQRKSFLRLARVVARAAGEGSVDQVELMTTADYIAHVRSAALVIGSDTSTQHVANYYGIPSLSCYPFRTGHTFYYFWGCPGPHNLCFRTPGVRDIVGIKNLASLVACLAESLASDARETVSPLPLPCDRYLQVCRAVATGGVSAEEGAREVERRLEDIRAIVPEMWTNFVFPELVQLAQEVCLRAKRRPHGYRDVLSIERLRDVYALKTVRLLALMNTSRTGGIKTIRT